MNIDKEIELENRIEKLEKNKREFTMMERVAIIGIGVLVFISSCSMIATTVSFIVKLVSTT